MSLLNRPKGTADILPSKSSEWQKLENFLHDTAGTFGFREIRVPTFEETELFSRGVGETTDVVQKEMYTVIGSKKNLTLRPEGTAGTIRALLENGLLNDALPQRVYYILSCFRHENVQKGRLREFHQFGVEMAGSAHPSADAEVISLAKQILDQLGLKGIALKINSIGCPVCRKKYQEALKHYFSGSQECLCSDCRNRLERNPMRLLDCKVESCQKIAENVPLILDYLCEDCSQHFEKLKARLEVLEIDYTVDPKIVRGLDYYTKTVFEFIGKIPDEKGKEKEQTICGGGRYDGLIQQLGGQSVPALGFGMGLERLLNILEYQGISLTEEKFCDIYFVPMGEQAEIKSMQLTAQLRKEGIAAQTDVMGRSLRAQMKYADKIGALYTMVLGGDEISSGKAKLKNMADGTVSEIELNDFTDNFQSIVIKQAMDAFGDSPIEGIDLAEILGGTVDNGND